MKYMKRTITMVLAILMVMSVLSINAFAADIRSPYELPCDVETGEQFACVASSALSNGVSRASLGTGRLYCENPLFGYPKGYAYTETNKTCYMVRAKCDVNNDGQSTSSSGWKEMNNTSTCNSGTITATTEKCTFTGYHEARETSTSGLYTTTSTKSYS